MHDDLRQCFGYIFALSGDEEESAYKNYFSEEIKFSEGKLKAVENLNLMLQEFSEKSKSDIRAEDTYLQKKNKIIEVYKKLILFNIEFVKSLIVYSNKFTMESDNFSANYNNEADAKKVLMRYYDINQSENRLFNYLRKTGDILNFFKHKFETESNLSDLIAKLNIYYAVICSQFIMFEEYTSAFAEGGDKLNYIAMDIYYDNIKNRLQEDYEEYKKTDRYDEALKKDYKSEVVADTILSAEFVLNKRNYKSEELFLFFDIYENLKNKNKEEVKEKFSVNYKGSYIKESVDAFLNSFMKPEKQNITKNNDDLKH